MILGDMIYHRIQERNFVGYLADQGRATEANQVHVPENKELAELADSLGLVQVGEARFGNGTEPGEGFTGLRNGFPGFTYNEMVWLIAAVTNDALHFGVGDSDGRIFAGEATNYLKYDSTNGLRIKGVFVVSGVYTGGFDVWCEGALGTPDGDRIAFSTRSTYQTFTLHVAINGVWQHRSTPDGYIVVGNNQFVMTSPPASGDILRTDYVSTDRTELYNETPSGPINNTNVQFGTVGGQLSESIKLRLNGQSLCAPDDYVKGGMGFFFATIDGGTGFITEEFPPEEGDIITASYLVEENDNFVPQEIPTGAIDSSNTVFTLNDDYESGTLFVVLNGIQQTITTNFTETGTDEITFVEAPETGDLLWITYIKA